MADISIALSNIQNIKTVEIQGLGIIKVRKMGAGEELDLSAKWRRLNKIIEELKSMDFSVFDTKKPEDLKKLTKLVKRSEQLSEEAAEIKQFEFDVYKRCISDDCQGKIVDTLMNILTDEERGALFREIFGEKKSVDAPESLTPEDSEKEDKNNG